MCVQELAIGECEMSLNRSESQTLDFAEGPSFSALGVPSINARGTLTHLAEDNPSELKG
jgi:hypothetical protein